MTSRPPHGRSLAAAALFAVLVVTSLPGCGGEGSPDGAAESTQGGGASEVDAPDGGYLLDTSESSLVDELAISKEVAEQGLADMEDYSLGVAERSGESFDDGRCFLILRSDGLIAQAVRCGPFVDAEEGSQFRTAAFALRRDGDEPIGFEHAPALNGLMQDQDGELVRPDGLTVDQVMDDAGVTTTTAPPDSGCVVTGTFTIGGRVVDLEGADAELDVRLEVDSAGRTLSNEYRFQATRWDPDTSSGFRLAVEVTEPVADGAPPAGLPLGTLDILDQESDLDSTNRDLAAARFTSRGFGGGTWDFGGASGFTVDAVLQGSVPSETAQLTGAFDCD